MVKTVELPPQPRLTFNQRQAYSYLKYLLFKEKQTSPPSCTECKKDFTAFEDVYEILQTSRCGYCQSLQKMPEEMQTKVKEINGLSTHFSEVFSQMIPFRPNVLRLQPDYT